MSAAELRAGEVAARIRAHRLVVVLRRIQPRDRLLDLVDELVAAGAGIFEVTMDAPEAADDLRAVRARIGDRAVVGAGTVLTRNQLTAAREAGADFGVSPLLDREVVARAVADGMPFIPGALTPTEITFAWDYGATFVKLFPASAVGPAFVRELRGPLPEVELIPTGGVDDTNARAFLDAGAVAVGMGGAIVRADPAARRELIATVVPGGSPA